jgi:hypothetical protein
LRFTSWLIVDWLYPQRLGDLTLTVLRFTHPVDCVTLLFVEAAVTSLSTFLSCGKPICLSRYLVSALFMRWMLASTAVKISGSCSDYSR